MSILVSRSTLKNNPAIQTLQDVVRGHVRLGSSFCTGDVLHRERLLEGWSMLLADVFALYVKTKSFQWQIPASDSANSYSRLDTFAVQIIDMADPVAERICKLGALPPGSIGMIFRMQRVQDSHSGLLNVDGMMAELHEDNRVLARCLKDIQTLVGEGSDVALDVWIVETNARTQS